MVLEIVGARFLQPFFGGSFYIWTSQIGVVMLALALRGWRPVGGSLATGTPLGDDVGPGGHFYFTYPQFRRRHAGYIGIATRLPCRWKHSQIGERTGQ